MKPLNDRTIHICPFMRTMKMYHIVLNICLHVIFGVYMYGGYELLKQLFKPLIIF